MNEESEASQEPGVVPEPVSPAQSPASGAPPAATPSSAAGHVGQSSLARTVVVVGVAVLVVVAAVFGAVALGNSDRSSRGSGNIKIVLASSHAAAASSGAQITVTGSGEVEGTPDTASFGIGVNTTASSAVGALEQNNSQVSSLEHSLEQSGVLAKDIQTSWLNLNTNTNNKGDVTGFSADDELNVTMHNLSDLGEALDSAVHATGNGVELDGINFSISNQSGLLAAARAQAMLSARTEASQLAAGAGLTLGSIVRVTDQENNNPNPVYYSPVSLAATASRVPVQAGQQQISVQVTVVYQLKSS
jgi:uncharacterized protein YggE